MFVTSLTTAGLLWVSASQASAHGPSTTSPLPPDGVLATASEALAAFFPGSERVGFERLELDEAQRTSYRRYVGHNLGPGLPLVYVASSAGKLDGLAVLAGDDPRVAVSFHNSGTVRRVRVLRLRDSHGTGVLDGRFLRQFTDATRRAPLRLDRDLRAGERCHRACQRAAQHVRHAVWVVSAWLRTTRSLRT